MPRKELQTWHRLALACCLSALLWGCVGLGTIRERPTVALAGIRVLDLGRTEQRFTLLLHVSNPNDVDIPLNGLNYVVEVNESPLASGASDQTVTIPRHGEAVLEVSAVSDLRGLMRKLGESRREGRKSVAYRVHGQIHAGQLGIVLPFDRKGEVALAELLRGAGSATAPSGM